MTKFIILTYKNSGKKVYVNPSAIQLISEKEDYTIVWFCGDQSSYITVSESPESIMNLIQNTEENNEKFRVC